MPEHSEGISPVEDRVENKSQLDELFGESFDSIKAQRGLKELFEAVGFQARAINIIKELTRMSLSNDSFFGLSDEQKKELQFFLRYSNNYKEDKIGSLIDRGYLKPEFALGCFKKIIDDLKKEINEEKIDSGERKRAVEGVLQLFESIVASSAELEEVS